MRILFLQPEDSPAAGPCREQAWDLVVDLGKSSVYSKESWARQYGCPVLAADSDDTIEGARKVSDVLSAWRGRLVDAAGIDWWNMVSVLIAQETQIVLSLRHLAREIPSGAELWATRGGGSTALLSAILGRKISVFDSAGPNVGARLARYGALARRFSPSQISQIFLDKYDSGYRWRARLRSVPRPCTQPVVLVPTAYINVSRMAAAYAKLLPNQKFLAIATRQSGRQFTVPANMEVRDLSRYARASYPRNEAAMLLERWRQLNLELDASADLGALSRAGMLDPVSSWIRNGLAVREAWSEVLNREPVCGVLCGDDSNRYTLLPVLLASRRKIPTVDFHHGAFDGRYLMKPLPCDFYLAKNEMERDYLLRVCGLDPERVVIGAPAPSSVRIAASSSGPKASANAYAILFSEPYEIVGMRTAEVYREILPALCRLARESNRRVVVKLHPFESRSQREAIVRSVLDGTDRELVTVVAGPMTDELMSRAWFGITVESTSVIDCRQRGIQCFLCAWVKLWPFGYVPQYARFGVGEVLESPAEIGEIPQRLAKAELSEIGSASSADPAALLHWLTGRPENVTTR